MGRWVNVDSLILEQQSLEDVGQGIMEFYSKEQIDNAETIEAIPKDQYEARLKAEKIAMLVDLKKEIEELKNEPACCHHYKRGVDWSSDIVQQKINELKAEQEET